MRLFFDTEFTDLKQGCDLISIGVIADCGDDDRIHCFYAESIEFGEDKCSDFVREHVLPRLRLKGEPCALKTDKEEGYPHSIAVCGTEEDIAVQLDEWMRQFVKSGEKIEIWSDCLAYDWVLFCNLFEGMGGIPSYVYYIPFDISTYMKIVGVDPDVTREDYAEKYYKDDMQEIQSTNWKHNSLFDAVVIYYCYKALERESGRSV